MSKASAARRLAGAAAYGGGGLGVLGGVLFGVLRAEAMWARRIIGPRQSDPPDGSGLYGSSRAGTAIRLAVLGDSAACGYGVDDPDQTTAAVLAAGLSEVADRPVRVTVHAVVGAQAKDLDDQIDRALVALPEIAVVLIGTNDVTHATRPSESVRLLAGAVSRLRKAGCEVVVGTCPDLGTLRPVAPPLRQLARVWSRRLAAAQTIAVAETGGHSVSLGSLLGPEFAREPHRLFGPDQFHPSADGYASVAAAMLPTLAAVLGVAPDADEQPETFRGEGVLPVSYAAAEAVRDSGTEVSPTEIAGKERGERGRWVALRHRRRHPLPDVERPVAASEEPG